MVRDLELASRTGGAGKPGFDRGRRCKVRRGRWEHVNYAARQLGSISAFSESSRSSRLANRTARE
jgi:hypothetical protein